MTLDGPPNACGSILFTDLVGFTEYTDAVGDVVAVRVLDTQRRVVDEQLHEHRDSRVVKELGDGLMIWFGSATTGLERTIAILHAFDGIRQTGTFPLAIRMGLHHGEAIARGDDLVGHTVNVAARISAIAGPGELLVSDEMIAAAAEAGGAVPLRPVGPVVVKGVRAPVWLHRFVADQCGVVGGNQARDGGQVFA